MEVEVLYFWSRAATGTPRSWGQAGNGEARSLGANRAVGPVTEE